MGSSKLAVCKRNLVYATLVSLNILKHRHLKYLLLPFSDHKVNNKKLISWNLFEYDVVCKSATFIHYIICDVIKPNYEVQNFKYCINKEKKFFWSLLCCRKRVKILFYFAAEKELKFYSFCQERKKDNNNNLNNCQRKIAIEAAFSSY